MLWNELKFKHEEFKNESPNLEIRNFLIWFVRTQMFEIFIAKKLDPYQKFAQMFDEAVKDAYNINESDHNKTSLKRHGIVEEALWKSESTFNNKFKQTIFLLYKNQNIRFLIIKILTNINWNPTNYEYPGKGTGT